MIESWHSTLEFELCKLGHFDAKAQARVAPVDFIEDYNTNRKHSALGMRSPVQHERAVGEQDGRGQAA